MAEERVQRRLAAILAADVAGYSRLMGEDEEGTLAALTAHRTELIEPCISQHRGRVVKTTGDGLLVEFASVVDSVRCAVALQEGMAERNTGLARDKRIEFRIGVNLGDVIVQDDDVYGDGVNVAARLEALAESGGLVVSAKVYEEVRNKLEYSFDDLGPQELKNIGEPVRAYHVSADGKKSTVTIATRTAPLPLPDKPSIAVLPFDNMSADPEQEYFSDGISEDIITDLSKVSKLFVISRNSSFLYKGKRIGVPQVGRELGVRYVLEGSVRRAGNRVRITAQLIDAIEDRHLWAERYDGLLDDVFSLQDEVAHKVVSALEVTLTAAERQASAPKQDVGFDAYDQFLRARQLFYRFKPEANAEGRRLLEHVIELEPEYVDAITLLAHFHLQMSNLGWSRDPAQTLQMASELAQRAIELDQSHSEGHVVLAHAAVWQKRHDFAVREADTAVELDPNSSVAHGMRSVILTWSGRPADAIAAAEAAIRLDPIAPAVFLWSLGHALYCLGRYGEAVASLRHSALLNADFMPVHIYLAACHVRLNNMAEAAAAGAEARRINPALSLIQVRQAAPYRDPAVLTALIDDLRKAGLPE